MIRSVALRLPAVALAALVFGSWVDAAERPDAARASAPQRIVSVGSDMTEVVYALGAGAQIVATDTTSSWPVAAQETTKVGYMRNLAAEGVLSLDPDLLLLGSAAGPVSTLQQLSSTGVPMERAPGSYTLAAVREKIALIGRALQRPDAAKALLGRFNRDVILLHAQQALLNDKPRVVFLLTVGQGTLQAAGKNTAAQAVLDLIEVENVFKHNGYKAVSTEAMINLNPAVILMMTQSIQRGGGRDTVLGWPAVSLTEAGRNGRLLGIDGAALLSFGPRVAASALDLAKRVRRSSR